MDDNNNQNKDLYFDEIIKKTKTGLTIPKQLRDELFEKDEEYFFRLQVPQEKDKLILKILTKGQADEVSKALDNQKHLKKKSKKNKNGDKKESKPPSKSKKGKESDSQEIRWGEVFLYDFEAKKKVKPVLESAFEKFSQEPVNFDDAMGRVKYALVSYLKASKSENAKLYYAVIRFLIKIIETFDQSNLIDWIYQKVIPHIESKFIYELALLDLIEICMKKDKIGTAETYVKEVLEDINEYPLSELYNIMSSLSQLVKKLKGFNAPEIFNLVKVELIKYNEKITNTDYKIQIIEMLEDLKYIEQGYSLADNLIKELHPESVKIADLRKIKKRLSNKPL